MERIQVSSSGIRAVGYDPASEILETELNDGSVYQYSNVPQGEYESLMSADSKGKYFNARIRGRYSYAKL